MADVDALAIVSDHDLEHAGPVPRLQQNRADRRLPRGLPAVRLFDSVIERIADEVGERCLQLFQDVAVDTGLLATHLQSYLFAEGPRNVADQPREAADAVGEWPHPAGEDFMVQPARKVFGAAREALELLAPPREAGEHGGGLLPEDVPYAIPQGRVVEAAAIDAFVECRDRVAEPRLRGAQRQQRVDEGAELPRLHQRFTRQANQSGEAVRRHPHHSVKLIEGRRRGSCRSIGRDSTMRLARGPSLGLRAGAGGL